MIYRCVTFIAILVSGLFADKPTLHAQTFRKGTILISLSEGGTRAHYSTSGGQDGAIAHDGSVGGDRDPLTIEYGISNKWSIGLSSGADILNVNTGTFYDFPIASVKAKAITSEFTLDGNYHFLVTNQADIAAFASVGQSSIFIKGREGDFNYRYQANGGLLRGGVKARYYFSKRFGALAMFSLYCAKYKPDASSNIGQGVTTTLAGHAIEFGLTYRAKK